MSRRSRHDYPGSSLPRMDGIRILSTRKMWILPCGTTPYSTWSLNVSGIGRLLVDRYDVDWKHRTAEHLDMPSSTCALTLPTILAMI